MKYFLAEVITIYDGHEFENYSLMIRTSEEEARKDLEECFKTDYFGFEDEPCDYELKSLVELPKEDFDVLIKYL